MMKTDDKENLVSRRSFFRCSVQMVLPMLMLAILPSCAITKKKQILQRHVMAPVMEYAKVGVAILVCVQVSLCVLLVHVNV